MPSTDRWVAKLRSGQVEGAWDHFISLYRKLIFSAIRHYADGYDDVMDVFAFVCEALRKDDLARLRKYIDADNHTATLSTWLIAVVRNLTVDWFRSEHGRRRPSKLLASLPEIQQEIYRLVVTEGRSHQEAFETLRSGTRPELTFHEFTAELGRLYREAARNGSGSIYRDLIGVDLRFEIPSPTPDPDTQKDRQHRIMKALEPLSEDDRAAVMLFVGEGMKAREVAEIVGWESDKTVYNRVSRALKRVKRIVSEEMDSLESEQS